MGGEVGAERIVQQDLIEQWHRYRIPITLAAVVVLALILALSRARQPSRSTREATPTLEKAKEGLTPESTNKTAPEKATPSTKAGKSSRGKGPKRVIAGRRKGAENGSQGENEAPDREPIARVELILFYFSLTTTTEKLSGSIVKSVEAWWEVHSKGLIGRPVPLSVKTANIADIEFDDYFLSTPPVDAGAEAQGRTGTFYALVIPSYNIDTVLDAFIEHLRDTHNDFRIDTSPLSSILGYTTFGIGDREGWPTEADGFCFQARQIDRWMARLSGNRRAFPLGVGDSKSDLLERLTEWTVGFQTTLCDIVKNGGLGEGVSGSGEALESDDEEDEELANGLGGEEEEGSALQDVEDIGRVLNKRAEKSQASTAVDFTTFGKQPSGMNGTVKEMVPVESPTYKALTKQGYSIVGSHSGVKICRWTKSALRGRGSCYKFSFYGIRSHLCMETTPSLSCSSKCVFCWRHGTNPVGTTWRWKVDPPEMIFEGVKAGHYKKIKMMKGVPGVRAERFQEAMRIRHCALSLVGEPIFYPYINEFTALLHSERISSFLVCNAQHPDQLAALKPVTQLYVSIDATNKESLRKVDRPLHRDFWERFLRCLEILREKRFSQRTVFRLTLVKGFNMDEVDGYADLIERGLPCFVEIKGVTYCGTSTSAAAGLTMQNVPFYEEVTTFVLALEAELNKRGLDYGIGAEHAHSCCVLLASAGRFKKNGRWHTLIDYDKFFDCLESGKEFGPEDYVGEATPEWAQWGNGGFNPEDERVKTKGKGRDRPGQAKLEG